MNRPSIPKGTRDFSPGEMLRRNYIFGIIREAFLKYGYKQIETPSMEYLNTLTGKYGEEGDRLIFKILNRGDKLKRSMTEADINQISQSKAEHILCDEALRYDLTVPFARYVVQHQNELIFPFKRFQMQSVWRADRPQKGRYREFYQCDADIVGSDSLINEVELIKIIDEVLYNLRFKHFTIKVNNRKILSGISEVTGESNRFADITVAIDKLDKIGEEGVIKELIDRGISSKSIEIIKSILQINGSSDEIFQELKKILSCSDVGLKGIEELETIFSYFDVLGLKGATLKLDMTLARGLNYYTGAIIEVIADDTTVGSICGGGRYDDLTGIFGLKGVSGVGISFGADRIYDILEDNVLFPDFDSSTTQILIINSSDDSVFSMQIADMCRSKGLNTEVYPYGAKLKKQMKYANGNHIPYVVFIDSESNMNTKLELKCMRSGEQTKHVIKEIIDIVKQ